jgi:heme-degrading monooxygenase HmoA
MILRVARARAAPGRAQALEEFLRLEALPALRDQPGLLRVEVGGPMDPGGDGFVMLTLWKDLSALKAFAGERWQEPKMLPDGGLLSDLVLEHYGVIETR